VTRIRLATLIVVLVVAVPIVGFLIAKHRAPTFSPVRTQQQFADWKQAHPGFRCSDSSSTPPPPTVSDSVTCVKTTGASTEVLTFDLSAAAP
jgi:hypothetical protein